MRVAAVLLVLSVAALAGCGSDDRRDDVNDYVRSANAIQRDSAPAFERANAAYRAFAERKLEGRRAVRALAGAERAIRQARARLSALEPPAAARRVHATLLDVYDRNLDFAGQTTGLATYQRESGAAFGPLDRVDRRLRADLRRADDPEAQARALDDFAGRLGGALRRLRRLDAPRILAPAHREQVRRLVATRAVARQLRRALENQDAKRVATLLVRFRETRAGRRPRSGLTDRALAAYDRRYRALQDAYAELYRRQRDLDATLR